MAYIIGTDEAGYGPNLGPLVITATAWQVPEHVRCEQLYQVLDGVVALTPIAGGNGKAPRLAIADSKRLYQPNGGLGRLELSVLAALRQLGLEIDVWSEVWDTLVPDVLPRLARIPWYADHDEPVPIAAAADDVYRLADHLAGGFDRTGVRLLAIESEAIFPAEWNRLLRLHNSKGAALSHRSIALARRMVDRLDDADNAVADASADRADHAPAGQEAPSITIVCDKHGGRNRYARLLGEYFPESVVEVHDEGRRRSLYRFGPAERRIECCFHARAESLMPVALASMVSKYLRELAMRALNGFWTAHVADLHPTAGYPADARRFKQAIATVQLALGIDDDVVWRKR